MSRDHRVKYGKYEEHLVDQEVISIRVWEHPVVINHWIMVISVLVLCTTGYLIAYPPFSQPGEASASFTLGTTRFLHITAGWLLLAGFLVRFYWGFAGNKFARWSTMLPLTKKRWLGMWEEVEDLAMPHKRLRRYKGHTPLANFSYIFLYIGVLFALITGFSLHSQAHYTPVWRFIAEWSLVLFGGNLNLLHLLHHFAIWIFPAFVMIHLYLVAYTVRVGRSTEIDAMISGRKLILQRALSKFQE